MTREEIEAKIAQLEHQLSFNPLSREIQRLKEELDNNGVASIDAGKRARQAREDAKRVREL